MILGVFGGASSIHESNIAEMAELEKYREKKGKSKRYFLAGEETMKKRDCFT